jgi:hypothetical protein
MGDNDEQTSSKESGDEGHEVDDGGDDRDAEEG